MTLLAGCVAEPGSVPSNDDPNQTIAPIETQAVAPSTPSPAPTTDADLFWTTPAAAVPPIDSSLPLDRWDDTRGAFSIVLLGPFGTTIASGQAVCFLGYESGPPILMGDSVRLLGEAVRVGVAGTPSLDRTDAASYGIVVGGEYQDPVPEGDAWVSRARGLALRVDQDVPEDVDEATFRRAFSGTGDAERMDVVVAWRCNPLDPDRTEPPPPTPGPTSVCPAPVGAEIRDIVPRLTLGRGSDQSDGVAGSMTFEQCGMFGGDDTPWITPTSGISLNGDAPLVVRLLTDGILFDAGHGATYAAAADGFGPSETWPLKVDTGTDQRSFLVEVPPPGDWSISVFVGINDVVHGVVWTSPYYFRVRILP